MASCIANSHALGHMSKFVRLWGPLWTHSALGFESKCGHLKNMFHGKSSVTEQLVLAADVAQTLQLVQQTLEENESEETSGLISKVTGQAPRGNMRKIKQHMYAVGTVSPGCISMVYSTTVKSTARHMERETV